MKFFLYVKSVLDKILIKSNNTTLLVTLNIFIKIAFTLLVIIVITLLYFKTKNTRAIQITLL